MRRQRQTAGSGSVGVLLVAVALALGSPVADAATYTWANNANGVWSSTGNWTPSGYPNASDDVASLATNINASRTVTQDIAAGVTVGGITFQTTSGTAQNWTLASNGITYQVTSGSAAISNVNSGASGNLITSSNVLASPLVAAVVGGVLTIAGPITESGGTRSLTKSGSGLLILSATNAYSGATIITGGGPLRAIDGIGLPAAGNLTFAGGSSATNAVLETTGTFIRAVGAAAGQVQWTGHGGFAAQGGSLAVSLNNSAATVTWGSGSFVPASSALAFGSATADSVVDFRNGIDFNGGDRQIDVTDNAGTTGDLARISGVLANGSLTKSGGGTLVVTNVSTYSGTTTVGAGALRADQGVGLPAASILQLRGGVIETTGSLTRTLGAAAGNFNWGSGGGGFSAAGGTLTVDVSGNGTPDDLVWGTTANFVPSGSPLIFGSPLADSRIVFQDNISLGTSGTATRDVQVNGNATAELPGTVSGSGGNKLQKLGTGTLFLQGNNSGFTGGIQVPNGAGGVIAFTNANALGTNRIYFGYGGSITLSNASASEIVIANDILGNNGGGKTAYLRGGNMTFPGLMDFDSASGSGALDAAPGVTVTWTGTNGTATLGLSGGGKFVLGQTNNAGKRITTVAASTVALAADNALGGADTNWSVRTLFNSTGDKMSAEGGPRTMAGNIGFAAYSETHYILGSNSLTINGQVSPYNNNASSTLVVSNTALTAFAGPVLGTLTGSGNGSSLSWLKAGPGTLAFTCASNTYSLRTEIAGGALRAVDGLALPTNSFLRLNGGVLESTGTFSRALGANPANGVTGGSQFRWSGSGGFAAQGGPLTVDVNGGGPDALVWNSTANFLANNQTNIFGSITADSTVTFIDNIDLNGAVRAIQVDDNPQSTTDIAVIAGNLSGTGASGINKTGAGTLFLNGTNTYTNVTTVVAGGIGGNGSLKGSLVLNSGTRFDAVIGNTLTVSNLTISANCTLNVANAGEGTIILYTGTLTGQFDNLSGLGKRTVKYDKPGQIILVMPKGSVITIR